MAKEKKSTLKFSEVIKRIESDRIAPVYFIDGDEDFLLLELLSALRNALFGKNPQTYFLSAFVKLGRFRSPTLIVDDREVHGSLMEQLNLTMNWFRERLTTSFTITDQPEREVNWEYPL